jgi:dihydroflavonol-4-reductase
MKALVTGATGFIGSHLVRELVVAGHDVRALVRPHADRRGLAGVDVRVCQGDLFDGDSLRRATRGCDTVFHTAGIFAYWGIDDETLARTMVEGTARIIAAAARNGVARFVLTSSAVAAGSSTKTIPRSERDRFTSEPGPSYFKVKALQEQAAFTHAAELALPLIAVLPTMTIGSNDYKLVPSNAVIVRYLKDPYHLTFPGGCNMVAVDDVARGHVLAALHGRPGERYILGAENLEWSLIHRTISELCNVPGPSMYADTTLSYLASSAMEWLARVNKSHPEVTRAEAETIGRFYWYRHDRAAALGYKPMSTRRAIAEATVWLLKSGHLEPSLVRVIRPTRELRAAGAAS